jgi:hypothetical protein
VRLHSGARGIDADPGTAQRPPGVIRLGSAVLWRVDGSDLVPSQ